MEKLLEKKSFTNWLKKLDAYDIYAPTLKDDLWNYEILSNTNGLDPEYLNTVLAPKKIIFPQREVYLEFSTTDEGDPEVKPVLPDQKSTIVLGVRPCDAKAATLTDMVFGGDFKDLYYWARRDQTVLIGLACNTPPSSNCFCLTVNGSPHSHEGLDILLTDLGDSYLVNALTSKGQKLLKAAPSLFKAITPTAKKAAAKIHDESEKKIHRQIKNLKSVPPKLKSMFDSPIWEEEAMSCLRCGICTYLCPTCHCFDIADEVTATVPLQGKRIRNWDTCQFPDFTMHSSGHNPRPDKASRLRQRLLHKFQYFVENFKNYQCTGCGRCVSLCPVGIDIIEVLDKVRDYG